MSWTSTQTDRPLAEEQEEFQPYRALSKAAIVSLALSLAGLLGLAFPVMLVLPAVGLMCGLLGLRAIRRFPDEVAGKSLALIGVIFSGLLLVGGTSLHAVVYLHEVPDGYTRISFSMLQPVKSHPDLPVSPTAMELSGKKVYIKGYVYPDGQRDNIQQFILVNDMGTCCFGGQPPLTHMVQVTLRDPLRVEYALRKRGFGGVLKVSTKKKPVTGLDGVYFELDGDYLR